MTRNLIYFRIHNYETMSSIVLTDRPVPILGKKVFQFYITIKFGVQCTIFTEQLWFFQNHRRTGKRWVIEGVGRRVGNNFFSLVELLSLGRLERKVLSQSVAMP